MRFKGVLNMEKFELFVGYFGNGATVCNSAVYDHGDYKKVAHISPAGNIKLFVRSGYIPADAMIKIENIARNHKQKTIDRLNIALTIDRYDFNHNYSRILDEIFNYTSYQKQIELINSLAGKKTPEKIELIKEYYLLNF